jgi:hypothetical protein
MNCNAFLFWMKNKIFDELLENPEALAHIQTCPACRQIYELDNCLESCIQQAFSSHRLPAGLVESIDDCVDQYTGPGRHLARPGQPPLTSENMEEPPVRKAVPDKTGLKMIQSENDMGRK